MKISLLPCFYFYKLLLALFDLLFPYNFPSKKKSFQEIEDKVGAGADSVEYMLDFWERFVRVEKDYARNLEDLCQSRYATLSRLFHSTSVEPIT